MGDLALRGNSSTVKTSAIFIFTPPHDYVALPGEHLAGCFRAVYRLYRKGASIPSPYYRKGGDKAAQIREMLLDAPDGSVTERKGKTSQK